MPKVCLGLLSIGEFLNGKILPAHFFQWNIILPAHSHHKIVHRLRCRRNKIGMILFQPVMHLSSTNCRVCDKFIMHKGLVGRKQFIPNLLTLQKTSIVRFTHPGVSLYCSSVYNQCFTNSSKAESFSY